jgi:hypothetical protein
MGLDITGIGGIVQGITGLVSKWIPDKTQEEQNAFVLELTQVQANIAASQSQLDINKVEAANPSVFVSGARPALMWTGVIGMAYQWILVPLGSFIYTTYTNHALPCPPPIISGDIMVMLGGLMGIHTVSRTVEKLNGVAAV